MKKLFATIILLALALSFSGCVDSASQKGSTDESQIQKFNVTLEIECSENFLFSRYDIEIFVDSENLGTIDHGSNKIFELQLSEGKHTLEVEEESNSSVDGAMDFSVQQDIKLKYRATCKSDQVKIELISEEVLSSESDIIDKSRISDLQENTDPSFDVEESEKTREKDVLNSTTQDGNTSTDVSTDTDSSTETEVDVPSYITVENNAAFANLMSITDQTDAKTINNFASLYKGKTIEFDGCVVFLMKHGNYTTRFDVCLVGCDYESERVYGPLFSFMDVSYYDMNVSGSDSVEGGMNFHIIAKIKRFDAAACCIELEPVQLIKR